MPISRRQLLARAVALNGALLLPALLTRPARAADAPPIPDATRPLLLRGGTVLTMDPTLGDFARADVLIENGRIAAVAEAISRDDAQLVDADGMIVMPGFVDTHRHMWQGQLRNSIPDATLADYGRDITGVARSHYRPEDAHIGNLLSAVSALNAGVTTVLDWSHIGNSPAHSDAAIAALRDAGIRAVYAYGGGTPGPANQFPGDITRLRREYFNSDDQLLSLALATGIDPMHWSLARDVGAPITSHINTTGSLLPLAQSMGPDNTYIHCTLLSDEEFDLILETGGGVSIAGPVEMEMGHGEPPFQQVIDRGIPWSLSNDVETEVPSDFFTQMQHAFTLQRMKIFTRQRAGETDVPPLITAREVVRVATLGGAEVNHLGHKCGSLTPGKEADVIMLDMNRINVGPVNDAYGAVLLGMDTSNVSHVLVAGKAVKWQGQLVAVDVAALLERGRESRDYIRGRAGWPENIV